MATHPIVEFPRVEDGARLALLQRLIEPRTVMLCHSTGISKALPLIIQSTRIACKRWAKPNQKPYFAVRTIGGTIGGKPKRDHSDLEKRIGKDLDRSTEATMPEPDLGGLREVEEADSFSCFPRSLVKAVAASP